MSSQDKTLLACGVITPQGSKTSRVTPNGWVIHCRDTVPVEHTVHTPMPRRPGRARTVFAWTVVTGFLLTLLAELVARLCAAGPVQ